MIQTSTMRAQMSVPPLPNGAEAMARVQHSRLRRRILYSLHQSDVELRIQEAVGRSRAAAWRLVDMTSNPAWYVTSQLAALYRQIPELDPPDGAEDAAAAMTEAGYWELAQRVQRDTIGLNDSLVRVDLDAGVPSYRLCWPDLYEVDWHPLRPQQPTAVREWIADPDDATKWVCLHVRPQDRVYRAFDTSGVDVSRRVLGGDFTGERYPWAIDGVPVLPYVAYHAAESGLALDPYTGAEVFEGTLQLGVYYSFFGHILRNAAWSQRYGINVRPAGGEVDEEGRTRAIVTDPATMLALENSDDAAPGSVGQFAPPISPDVVLASIERYERRLVEMALSQVGVSRRESDVRSAMSLAVSREQQREAQLAYAPVFGRSDRRLCQLTAGLMGLTAAPWRIQYKAVGRDASEMTAEAQRLVALVDAGLMTKVEAYQVLHPAMSDIEATAAIAAMGG
jgi:hypothetical protein